MRGYEKVNNYETCIDLQSANVLSNVSRLFHCRIILSYNINHRMAKMTAVVQLLLPNIRISEAAACIVVQYVSALYSVMLNKHFGLSKFLVILTL